MTWAEALVPHLKALHLSFLALWVAGVLALPRMLARHDPVVVQAEFDHIRRATHYGYIWVITPVAVLTIATGTALVFMLGLFTVWILAKFVMVAGLVAVHAWVGHSIIRVAETEGRHQPPEPLVPTLLVCGLVIGILCLVLAKPELNEVPLPSWMLQPLGRQLPFDIPNR